MAPFSYGGNLLPCSDLPHSLRVANPYFVLSLSTRYVNCLTIHIAALPAFPPSCVQNVRKTVKSPFSLQHIYPTVIHLPHCTHKAKLAFIVKLQNPHRSALLLDKLSFVIPPLTITFVFPMSTLKP